jgi:pSer/pThr/pTyr-binding forkhead associated (FHA) protein
VINFLLFFFFIVILFAFFPLVYSSNGTFVDGQKVGQGKKVVIRDSAEISLLSTKEAQSIPIAFLFRHFERSQVTESTDLFKFYTLGEVLGQ